MVGAGLKGVTGVLGFWDTRRMCVFNFRVVYMDIDTYVETQLYKFLFHNEWSKKRKYLEACLDWMWHFMPLVLSMGVFMG